MEGCRTAIATIIDLGQIEERIRALTGDIAMLVAMSKQLVKENARVAMDQDEFKKRHNDLVERYNKAQEKLASSQAERHHQIERRKSLTWFIDNLEHQEGLLTEFDDGLFLAIVESMTVNADSHIDMRFKDRTVIGC